MATPQTQRRIIPNSSKKRAPSSTFSRSSATPSHASKMSAIFRDAAIPLQDITTPSKQWSSNTKTTRIPLPHARNLHFGTFYSESILDEARVGDTWTAELPLRLKSSASTTPRSYRGAPTPSEISHGTRFPTPPPYRHSSPYSRPGSAHAIESHNVTYPSSDSWAAPRSPSRTATYDSTEECHSSHGVPLVLSIHTSQPSSSPKSSVHAWLDSVPASSTAPNSPQDELDASSSKPAGLDPSSTPPPMFISSPKLPLTHSTKPCKAASFSSDSSNNAEPCKPASIFSGSSSNKENHAPPTLEQLAIPPRMTVSPPLTPVPAPTTRYLSANLARCGIRLPETPKPKLRTPEKRLTSYKSRPASTASSPEREMGPPATPSHNLRSSAPSPPSEYLRLSPKRRKAVGSESETPHAVPVVDEKANFAIYDDEGDIGVVPLSPEVQRHRKGRGPKRDRCVSYWDEDVLGHGVFVENGQRGSAEGTRKQMAEENVKMEELKNGKGRPVPVEKERSKERRIQRGKGLRALGGNWEAGKEI